MEVGHAVMPEKFWSNEEDLESHLRSDEYRKALLVVEMDAEIGPPQRPRPDRVGRRKKID